MWRGTGTDAVRRPSRNSMNVYQVLKKRRKRQRPPLRPLVPRTADIPSEVASVSALESGSNLRHATPPATTSSSSGQYAMRLAQQPTMNSSVDDPLFYSDLRDFNSLSGQTGIGCDAPFTFYMNHTSSSPSEPHTQSRPVIPEPWKAEGGPATFVNANWKRFVLDIKNKNGVYDAADGIMDSSAQFSVVSERFARERGLNILPMFPGYQWKSIVTPLGVLNPEGYVILELKSAKHRIPKMMINVLVVNLRDLQAGEMALTDRFDVFFGSAFTDKLKEMGHVSRNTTTITGTSNDSGYDIPNDTNVTLPSAIGSVHHNYGDSLRPVQGSRLNGSHFSLGLPFNLTPTLEGYPTSYLSTSDAAWNQPGDFSVYSVNLSSAPTAYSAGPLTNAMAEMTCEDTPDATAFLNLLGGRQPTPTNNPMYNSYLTVPSATSPNFSGPFAVGEPLCITDTAPPRSANCVTTRPFCSYSVDAQGIGSRHGRPDGAASCFNNIYSECSTGIELTLTEACPLSGQYLYGALSTGDSTSAPYFRSG